MEEENNEPHQLKPLALLACGVGRFKIRVYSFVQLVVRSIFQKYFQMCGYKVFLPSWVWANTLYHFGQFFIFFAKELNNPFVTARPLLFSRFGLSCRGYI